MGQVTIYLDPATEEKMKILVKQKKMSRSKWIAGLICEKTANAWPDQVQKLAGAWKDLPSVEEIRKKTGTDIPREEV
ncbi:MAG: CopG family transcriptional regulator [Deltaproteobacteria bacterium]|nr:CopG family transcriptional regulator [Deltaproteobacteria bacterium]